MLKRILFETKTLLHLLPHLCYLNGFLFSSERLSQDERMFLMPLLQDTDDHFSSFFFLSLIFVHVCTKYKYISISHFNSSSTCFWFQKGRFKNGMKSLRLPYKIQNWYKFQINQVLKSFKKINWYFFVFPWILFKICFWYLKLSLIVFFVNQL